MASAALPTLSVLLCALAFILYSSPADADSAVDCCLTVSYKEIPKPIIHSYKKQVRGEGCPRDAVVFKTRKGVSLCSPTASEAKWVEELTKHVDNRFKKCKEIKFKGKRCEGLNKAV
ncbi:C-C motif chemokine 19a.1 [Misgurnus anguillicaudatus]|uniref:C-C motif chemokine 19a.1 n=1 Tax=Misgurnus anguillicaudatus TaxID=75329 RepID=UPI003CCF1973